jgi:hypothetical protein
MMPSVVVRPWGPTANGTVKFMKKCPGVPDKLHPQFHNFPEILETIYFLFGHFLPNLPVITSLPELKPRRRCPAPVRGWHAE